MRPHRSFRVIRVAGFDSVQNDSVVIQRQVLGALAQCYKGGSPVTSGTVVMRRLKPDKIDVSLRGFFQNSEKPEVFCRCHVQGGGTRDGVSLTTMQQEPRSGFGSATRNRDTEKADIHNRVDEAAGDIDGRDPPRRFEDLSGSDGVPFKYVPLDTKDIAVIETDGRHLLYRKEGLGIVVIVARSKLRRHLMKEPWGDTEPALEGFANACCR